MTEAPDRPSTPAKAANVRKEPRTPEAVRRIEENRLRAKALREQHEAAARAEAASGNARAGLKRPYASSAMGAGSKDTPVASGLPMSNPPDGRIDIRPAKKSEKYVEYDFSSMVDTKGGFLSATDDPHNRAMYAGLPVQEKKPEHMTEQEWERFRLLRQLKAAKAGPFEPGVSAFEAKRLMQEGRGAEVKKCADCDILEIDWKWDEIFGVGVCHRCKDAHPEKYSLLTKTEVREDYLLTDPELKDVALLPHLSRPNPHKSSYSEMRLYLRKQVEEYAFSSARWGSAEALDAEHDRRDVERKKRKEKKFTTRLNDLRRRTRVEAWKRSRGLAASAADTHEAGRVAQFGDRVGDQGKHVHQWGRPTDDPKTGASIKSCTECGMEVEELEF